VKIHARRNGGTSPRTLLSLKFNRICTKKKAETRSVQGFTTSAVSNNYFKTRWITRAFIV